MSDKETEALMKVLAEMRREGPPAWSAAAKYWADRIQDALEEACED